MLSFDITDRNVRIIKGTETNGKIKIQKAATLDLEEDVIVRGIPKDPVMLATQLNLILKSKGINDKEAIMSISSNHTIFKELSVPYTAKSNDFANAVKKAMQDSVSVVDDTYSISYIITKKDASENLKEDKDSASATDVTVLATACPHEIIDAYRVVFQYLNISLKSIIVANNCITKVLLADAKLKQKMPFMAVQIDKNFISMNVYQDNQLSFSRFASIDDSDYSEGADYILDAIHDNVSRMLQFQRNRSSEPINHIVFYGDTSERYRDLADDMEQMGLTSSVISVPPLISGYENLEFSNYANAIGAMFKRDKETEKINLLELGGTAEKVANAVKSNKNFGAICGVIGGGTLAIVAVIAIVLNIRNASIESKIDACNEYINSPTTISDLAKHDERTAMLESVNAYKSSAQIAVDAYKSRPILQSQIIDTLDTIASSVDSSIKFVNFSYLDGVITVSVSADGKSNEFAQSIPTNLVDAIVNADAESNLFYNADYTGYSVTNENTQSTTITNPDGTITNVAGTKKSTITFNLTLYTKSDVDVVLDNYIQEETIEDTTGTGEESVQ